MKLQLLYLGFAMGAWAQDLFQGTDDVTSVVTNSAVGACGNLENDTNYLGSDIKKSVSANSVEECCNICNKEPGCKFFTFHQGRRCYLKSSKEGSKMVKGDVSGAASSSPTPPSPPSPPTPAPPAPTPTPSPPAPPSKHSLPMKNAAKPGMHFPIMGLGVEGHGWEIGQKMECWHWPQCCTKDYCPSINAVKEYIKEAKSQGFIPRIDTGYPYGDDASSDCGICKAKVNDKGELENSVRFLQNNDEQLGSTGCHKSCDTKGVGMGIKQSGVKRSDIFVTVKAGYAGPMGGTKGQVKSLISHLGIGYADLCLVHMPEVGPGTGSHGEYGPNHCVPGKKGEPYSAAKCRVNTYRNILDEMKAGMCKAVGVNNWNASDIEEIEKAGLELPSVVQYKFHLHQSTKNPIQKDLVDYTQKHGIILNGFAPLGVPDWVTFTGDGMATTLLDEPLVKEVAKKVSKTPAQVLLRWVIQQGVATHARTMKPSHMQENLDIFDWELSSDDMAALSNMPQCTTQRGLPYAKGDPNGGSRHDHVIGITEHC